MLGAAVGTLEVPQHLFGPLTEHFQLISNLNREQQRIKGGGDDREGGRGRWRGR